MIHVGRPNLFDFATSELSQDAFLCWLAAIADHDEPALRGLGRSFIAWLWQRAKGELIDVTEVTLLGPPRRQVDHIDILFEASIRNARTLFLIEDKTETSHHSGQLARYRARFRADETVVPIYFKTGYHFGADTAAAAAGYTVISLEEWCEFLVRHDPGNDIFEDYRAYVMSMRDGRRSALAVLDTADGAAAFKQDFVQYEYMRQLVAGCPESIGDSLTYKGRSIGGEPWTQHRFATFAKGLAGAVDEALFHRIDRRQQGWYLATRQYAVVKGNVDARAAKLERLQQLRKAFVEAVASSAVTLTFGQPSADRRGKNESEIGVLFFDPAVNTPASVLAQFPVVHRSFVQRIESAISR